MLLSQKLTERMIGLAIEVHRQTGPGLLESVYESCLCLELGRAGIDLRRQVGVPVTYKGLRLDEGFRADIIVAGQVILEIKALATILPAHEAQLKTHLCMSGIRIGLLLNFYAPHLKDGLRRFVGQDTSVALRGSRPSPC
jgi:GxxExxY protein